MYALLLLKPNSPVPWESSSQRLMLLLLLLLLPPLRCERSQVADGAGSSNVSFAALSNESRMLEKLNMFVVSFCVRARKQVIQSPRATAWDGIPWKFVIFA
jgi:hypothetical protein